ncbi:endonuclease/exonuclease/phosphatase family protein [Fulvivirgaceae bacterium LMO-SS25]
MIKFYIAFSTSVLLCHLGIGTVSAQIQWNSINTPYIQNFNNLASDGFSDNLPQGWYLMETGTSSRNDGQYVANNGASNSGDIYSYGQNNSDNRSFGSLLSGSLSPSIGAYFVNNTGSVITALKISYTGKMWRLGNNSGRLDFLEFSYSQDASSLNSGTYNSVSQLDFVTPNTAGNIGPRDGDNPSYQKELSQTISGLNMEPGSGIWLKWEDINATGADDGLAIDNFSIVPMGQDTETPIIITSPTFLSYGNIQVGASKVLSYQVTSNNLNDSIHIISDKPELFSLSADGVNFSNEIHIAVEGQEVLVKFNPQAIGSSTSQIRHRSGNAQTIISVIGSGFDPYSNIISIAEARDKQSGDIVTVGGRVTAGNQFGSPSFIQDATGGIPIFNSNFSSSIEIGDSVLVYGTIGFFNDLIQITGSNLLGRKVDVAKRFVSPKQVELSEIAQYEGQLVTVVNVELRDKSFVFYPNSTEIIEDQDGIEAQMRIVGSTDIPGLTKPQAETDITGVVGRFRANAQLQPRFQPDIPGSEIPTSNTDQLSRNTTLDVATWNIEFFGARREDYDNQSFGPDDVALQAQNVRRVLDSLQSDIIAVQEVSNTSHLAEMVALMPGYAYICSDRYSYSWEGEDPSFAPQKICFIYRTSTVEIVSQRVMFEEMFDAARAGSSTALDNYPGNNPSSFYSSGRLPFELKARVTIGSVQRDITFINIHAKSGGSDIADYNRRQFDALALKDTLATYYQNQHVILLGDLNDDLDASIIQNLPSPYSPFTASESGFLPISKALSLVNNRSTTGFSDMIDHIIVSASLEPDYIPESAKVIAPFRMIPNYANNTSDHLAVTARFELLGPIARFDELEAGRKEGSGPYTKTIRFAAPTTEEGTITIEVELGEGAVYGKTEDFYTLPATQNNQITLNVPAGSSSISFTIIPNVDNKREDEETATFKLLSSSGGVLLNELDEFTFTIIEVWRFTFATKVVISPNPTSGIISLVPVEGLDEDTIVTATLKDFLGRILYNGTANLNQLSQELSTVLTNHNGKVYLLYLGIDGELGITRILKR